VRRLLSLLVALVAAAIASVALAGPAAAHPLGNFTVNQYSGLRVAPDGVRVDYVLDLAEIPAYQVKSQVDADPAGWRVATCGRIAGAASLALDGRPVPLVVGSSTVDFPPGAAGLTTLRLGCQLRAAVRIERRAHVSYRTGSYADRVGWREVTAVGDGTTLSGSTVPATSRSARLTAYPADLLSSPLDVRGADLDATPGGGPAAAVTAATPDTPLARGVDRATAAFTSLVARRNLTLAFGLVAVLLSVFLGALHAFAPGHGKTVMAAFLVGGRGTLRQALTVGLTVTATHTAGVLVLGTVLTTSVALAPQTLYPWLGVTSGLILAAVGISLFRRVRAGGDLTHTHGPGGHIHGPHGHSHGPGDEHAHSRGFGYDDEHARGDGRGHSDGHRHSDAHGHGGEHRHSGQHAYGDHGHGHDHAVVAVLEHGHDHADHGDGDHARAHDHADHGHGDHGRAHGHGDHAPIRRRGLLAMGFAGGLVPSPSALVVLLGAIALGRTWFGILLVVGYGAGMAAALMGIGLLLARGRRLLERRALPPRIARVAQWLPTGTALLVVAVGLGLAGQAALVLTS
jgi:nickel/cobalt transporter (NicO) family protein